MKKRNFSFTFVVAGLVMAFLLSASPMIAGELQVQDQKTFKSWLSTLTEEQRHEFEFVIQSNLNRIPNLEEKSKNELSELVARIYQDLQEVLPPDRFADLKLLSQGTVLAEIMSLRVTCGPCYWVNYWAEHGYNYILDAKSNCVTNYDAYCDPPPPPYGIPSLPCASLYLAEIFGKKAMDDFWAAYTTCDCTRAQQGLTNAQRTLTHLNRALQAINEDNCGSNPPWKDYINMAIMMFNNTVNSAQGCINEACGS